MEHAANSTSFGVRNCVKDFHELVRIGYLYLYRVCLAVDPVVLHRLTVHLEKILVPGAKLRPQCIKDMMLREPSKSLVKPDVVPPVHRDIVTKPHVA